MRTFTKTLAMCLLAVMTAVAANAATIIVKAPTTVKTPTAKKPKITFPSTIHKSLLPYTGAYFMMVNPDGDRAQYITADQSFDGIPYFQANPYQERGWSVLDYLVYVRLSVFDTGQIEGLKSFNFTGNVDTTNGSGLWYSYSVTSKDAAKITFQNPANKFNYNTDQKFWVYMAVNGTATYTPCHYAGDTSRVTRCDPTVTQAVSLDAWEWADWFIFYPV